ncbi:MAG TPA: FtsX-like permease family protein [Acidimicrobiales bacterium]|nr:FtsX-like permease family protein [Acidimicrobiales bacterium]
MNFLASLATSARGLISRAGAVATIFVVAVVAVAAAVAAPAYYAGGKRSILADTLSASTVLGDGIGVTQSGPVSASFEPLTAALAADLGRSAKLFAPAVEAREATAVYPAATETLSLVSRTGLCAHLAVRGACPTAAGQIMATPGLARANGWELGQRIRLPAWGTLTLTGLYTPPRSGGAYWFDRLTTYFPVEYPLSGPGGKGSPSAYDALFTAPSTLLAAGASAQGDIVIDQSLDPSRVSPAGLGSLSTAVQAAIGDQTLAGQQAVVQSDIPTTVSTVRRAWTSLSVPVLVVTLELLALAWLLLFVLFGDASEARGPEVALAKLRGYSRWRTSAFALSEPLLLLATSYPVGLLAGWGVTELLGRSLLRPGTALGLPGLGWATGALAVAGGVAAVVVAGRRTLRRDVMAQWRHTGDPTARGWVVDTVLLTAAVAGLVELEASGALSSTDHPLTLLFPGLLGLAVAVVASRLLPLICAAAAALSRRGVVGFLALRQVARRPSGSRTTTILAASFALATFAVSAWAVAGQNYQRVATLRMGAPVVLDVTTPAGSDLAADVARADPSGRRATPVEEYSSNGSLTMAVDPARWNAIAAWRGARLPARTVAALNPPEAAPLVLHGDALRVHLDVSRISLAQSTLNLDFQLAGGVAPTPVQLAVPSTPGPATATVALPPCPCTLSDVGLSGPPADAGGPNRLEATVAITGLDVHGAGGWKPVPAAALAARDWYAHADGGGTSRVSPRAAGGLRWIVSVPASVSAVLSFRDRPFPLPALAAAPVVDGRTGPATTAGLDGRALPVDVIATAGSVPGGPADGVVVDIAYAQIAAAGDLALTVQQVWTRPGSGAAVAGALRAEGVQVQSVRSAAEATAALDRSGPGLAENLFLAEAAAAALLASGGSVLALYLFARRRRYEMAALASVGVTRRSLLRTVVSEQLIVLGYGAAVGMITGLVAVLLAVRDVPEFATRPAGIPLATFPSATTLAVALAAALVVIMAAGTGASLTLMRSVTASQLREAPQ